VSSTLTFLFAAFISQMALVRSTLFQEASILVQNRIFLFLWRPKSYWSLSLASGLHLLRVFIVELPIETRGAFKIFLDLIIRQLKHQNSKPW